MQRLPRPGSTPWDRPGVDLLKPLPLPRPLERRLDRFARAMLQPPGMEAVDFRRPEWEPALIGPDSISWRVFKNPLTLFIGGVAAVLLEFAEPRVRHGVWDNSSFRDDPLPRLQRTGLAAMVTVYGPRSTAGAMIAGVNRLHGGVGGLTDTGRPYRADDPDLLTWVQATASFGFLEAYAAYAGPITDAERDLYYAEAAPAGRLYGALAAPTTGAELETLFRRMAPAFEPSATIFEFLNIMADVPALPALGRPLQAKLVRAAVAILPAWVRERIGLGAIWSLHAWERSLIAAMARAADRLFLPSSPPVQACLRLGLPGDYLYK